MRLPFFKTSKPQPVKTQITPPRPAALNCELGTTATPQPCVKTPSPSSAREVRPASPLPVTGGAAIPLAVGSILQQLPMQFFVAGARDQLACTTIALPLDWVVPQLATGRIHIRLADLLTLMPADLLQQPVPTANHQHTIALPLAEIVEAMPPDLLTRQYDATIEVDTPDFEQLPKLFDEPQPEESTPAPQQPVAIQEQPEPVIADASITEPEPKPQAIQPAAQSGTPSQVSVSLRSLVAVMPDHVFACPRTELWRRVNLDSRVWLPLEPILPQLSSARVRLPLQTVIQAMPSSLFVSALPQIAGDTVPLPLKEIVPQLPPQLFAAARTETPQPLDEAEATEFATPFQEKAADAAQAQAPAPAPQPPVEPQPPQPVIEVARPEQLEEESIPIFAEKSTTPTAEVAQPLAAPCAPTAGDKFLVNLNQCSVQELAQIQGIGPALARRIIEFRDTHGPFTSLEQLRQVPGIGRKTFRSLAGHGRRSLNRLLGVPHDEELTLQEIVRRISAMPGIEGCMLAMADGEFLTGQLPAHLDQNAVSVFAPQLFKKVGRYMRELRVGRIHRLSIFAERQPLSIFRADEIYLVVIHDHRHYSKALLRRCERISQEIARFCRQRAVI